MILAIDTATRWTGLALHDGTAVIAEAGWRSINTQTIELSPAIAGLLKRADTDSGELKGIAVAIGPGSYTGLRVGLAVAKGIALAHQTPLLGVPTLDIVAAGFGALDGKLVIVAEAGRTRVCAAVYRWNGRKGWQANAAPIIESWPNLLDTLADEPITFAGEITLDAAKQIRAANKAYRLATPAASTRRAGCLAEIGWQRLRKGQLDDVASLAPIYLKDPGGN
ncbi:MAG: tRNA (adenosine(37)-N6)-threonylcarbamoyltransferase complex dimerization subunit type 1 TsaB [Chloroflexota bacterium]|nr:tRNA (adenosine(37)-N6)-threonylcarbamoyltransferase complex dimerization subunit type 1 TsaB [Ardenticatenaceae bacterium]